MLKVRFQSRQRFIPHILNKGPLLHYDYIDNNIIRICPLGGPSRLDHQVWRLVDLRVACGSSPALE